MRVAIEATSLSLSSGGLARYTSEIAVALARCFPDGQFFLLLSVTTIAFVMFLGFGVALCLRRRRYEKFDDLPNMDNGVYHDDPRILNRWGWVCIFILNRPYTLSRSPPNHEEYQILLS